MSPRASDELLVDTPSDPEQRQRTVAEPDSSAVPEDIHVRNYDVTRTYSVTVTVRDEDGVCFRCTYRLKPGSFHSEFSALDPGTYEVEVETSDGATAARTCRVDNDPAHTVFVETGNMAVSVSEGVY